MTDPLSPKPGALFVDFENVFYALVGEPFGLLRESAMSATMEALNQLRRRLRETNHALVVERSYADWEKMPTTAQRQLQISGVLPIFVDARIDKNTADIELSLDVLQNLLTRRELQYIALVGGDRDYLPILRRVKEHHRSITVCSFRASLAGDVREFVSNYAEASIVELDALVDLSQYPRLHKRTADDLPEAPPSSPVVPSGPVPARSVQIVRPKPREYRPDDENYEWHERYLQAMARFMREKRFREVHLGPFIRWLQAERIFELVSGGELRKVFDDLVALDAVRVEERDTAQGYPFSVAMVNYNHPLVQKVNEPD